MSELHFTCGLTLHRDPRARCLGVFHLVVRCARVGSRLAPLDARYLKTIPVRLLPHAIFGPRDVGAWLAARLARQLQSRVLPEGFVLRGPGDHWGLCKLAKQPHKG